IHANPKGLLAGQYNAAVTLSVPGSPNTPVLIPVTLNVLSSATSPSALSVSPASGGGSGQTFTAVFSDPVSYTNLHFVDIIFGSPNSLINTCQIRYDPMSTSFKLRGDDGSTWSTLLPPGDMSSIENSQCILSGIGSSVSGSGAVLTIRVAVSFKLGFIGNQTIYGATENAAFATSRQTLGTWTVNSTPAGVSATPAWGAGVRQTFR